MDKDGNLCKRLKAIEKTGNFIRLCKRHINLGVFKLVRIGITLMRYALDSKCTLVTNNTSDFKNIRGLRLEGWAK